MKFLIVLVFSSVLAGSAVAESKLDIDEIRSAQQVLRDEGYLSGPADGETGWRTSVAIILYQKDWHLPVTGLLDSELLARLERRHPDTRARWQMIYNRNCKVRNLYPHPEETVTWDGLCQQGRATGFGRLEWSMTFKGERSSQTYVGEMLNGIVEGPGLYTWASGATFEGVLKDGKAQGHGVYTFSNGNWYEGNFVDDEFNGKGTLTFAGGGRYEGEFKDSEFDGQGVFFFPEGNRYVGEFRNGVFDGNGFLELGNGDSHEGQYRNGRPNGFGVFFRQDVEALRGEWKDGCLEVEGTFATVGKSERDCGFNE